MAFNIRKHSLSELSTEYTPHKETFTMPTMVLPCHNLSVQQIFEDYCRGVIHTGNYQAVYDDGEDIVETERIEDISDISSKPTSQRGRRSAPSEPNDEKPSDNGAQATKEAGEATQHPEDERKG